MKRERELKTKKKWVTPQLIVLVRGKSEEGVLLHCKWGRTFSHYPAPWATNYGCSTEAPSEHCMSCESRYGS